MIERTEDETNELVKSWLAKYGLWLVVAVVILIGTVWFFSSMERKQTIRNLDEQKIYLSIQKDLQIGDVDQALITFGNFNSDSSYQSIAALEFAKYFKNKNNIEDTLKYLSIASDSDDEVVKQTAQFDELQLDLTQKNYAVALEKIRALKGGVYDLQLPIIEGDIFYAQGDLEQALNSYLSTPYINSDILLQQKVSTIKAQLVLDTNHSELNDKEASL